MQPNSASNRIRDILLLIFSSIGIAGLTIRGGYYAFAGIFSKNTPEAANPGGNLFDILGTFMCAALLLPLMIHCIRRLKGREIRVVSIPPIKLWQLAVLFTGWLAAIILGLVISNQFDYGWVFATPFYLLGILLPIAGLAWVAVGGLPTGCVRRLWAAFSIGMVGSTTLAMVVEYTLVLMAALAGGIIAVGNPEFRHILEQVKDQITNSGDVQSLLTSLAPYLTNPMVLVVALLFTAVIAPVFEEALKPVALWFLGKRMSSASEGFALGALCGAGFALLEGTLAAGGMAEMLGFGLAARMTSSLMHITASGIMGWGIASAILDKRYWRLAGAYLLSVSIHGLWNGSVILSVFGALRVTLQGISNPDIPGMVLVLAGILTLGASFLTIIILLPVFNRRLRPKRLSAGFAEQSVIIRPPENQS